MMQRKCCFLCAVVVGAFLCCALGRAHAQQSDAADKSKAEESEKKSTAYRLDLSMNEMEDGKIVNSRQYALNLNTLDAASLKIGTRVPVEAKQGELQYIDVGTNIWARLRDRGNELALEVRVDATNFATPDQQSRNSMPMLRQLQINGSTIVQQGKPMVVGIVDDPNSKRQFQLSVVVTKIH